MNERSSIGPHTSTPMDRLVGRPVVDRDGKSIGRIHELRADVNGDDWTVTHFVVGVGGLLERFGVAPEAHGWRKRQPVCHSGRSGGTLGLEAGAGTLHAIGIAARLGLVARSGWLTSTRPPDIGLQPRAGWRGSVDPKTDAEERHQTATRQPD